jgi:nitroreductase
MGSVPTMELSEAVRRRRMTRNFSEASLDRTVVDGLLAEALAAPSAGNTQGREFVVLDSPAQTGRYWLATTDADWRARSRRFQGLSRAPVVVLPFSDPDAYVRRYAEPDKARPDGDEVEWVVPYWHVDASFAVMSLLLGAVDRGVGAAFLGNFRGEGALKEALGVPARMRWLGAVLLGHPALPDPPSPSATRPRRTMDESVHRGGW